MRPVPGLRIFLGLFLLLTPSDADELKPEAGRKLIPEFSYCVAYVLREPKEGDVHASLPDPDYPYNPEPTPENPEGLSFPAGGIIITEGEKEVIDVAALAALVVQQARLTTEQARRVASAASVENPPRFPRKECYMPHHAFVFYSRSGQPVGCIELCFTCNGWRLSPGSDWRPKGLDSAAMAKMFEELKLPLTPYPSFAAYETGKKRELELEAEGKKEFGEDIEELDKEGK